MVKLFFIAALMVFAIGSAAGQGQEEPSLDKWIADNTASDTYPFSIIILESEFKGSDLPVVSKVSKEVIDSLSFFRLQSTKSLAWDIKINDAKLSGLDGTSILEKLTDAKYYFFVPQSGKIVFAKKQSDGSIVELFSTAAKTAVKWDVLFRWVQSKLGWDGVVLDRIGNRFIVGAPSFLLKAPDIQALAIAESHTVENLPKESRTGAALLSLVQKQNGFGLFEVVFSDGSSSVQQGTKLIIERRKAK